MLEPLSDLSITLAPPPQDAAPETLASIELRCDQLGLQHTGDVLKDPFTLHEREDVRWYLTEYVQWPYEQFLTRGKQIEDSLPSFGKRLYQAVCGSSGAMGLVQAWRLQPGVQRQLSIISDLPRALSLPWELLHDEQGFLALRARNPVSLIRRLPQRELVAFPSSFAPPLRILLVTARPDNTGFTDPRSIARELLDEVQKQVEAGAITLEFLRPPTLPTLRARLSDTTLPPIQVLHFDGHGIFSEEKSNHGLLAFEEENGQADLVEADRLAQVLQDSGVRLAVLTACQSAMGATDDAFSSVAAQLIRSGVDAVTAMSGSVLVVSAIRYAEAFYRALAGGVSAPMAQERARQALHDDPRRNLHRRRMDDEGTVVTLSDWWLPHYYQQRPVSLQPERLARKRKKAVTSLPRFNEDFPPEPRYGFSGRAYELLRIERFLMHDKIVVIAGFGGMGKTALAREAADWLTRTNLHAGACFVSFEHGGDATTLLAALGRYLNVYDGNYNPNETKAALQRVQPILKTKRILVIADNLESILANGEAALEPAVRSTLWDVVLELDRLGAGILLTTRDTAFGDGRLAPGNQTAYLPLQGLYPDDAYALATRLLNDLNIDRARAPYKELLKLLLQLDRHPLAIQLVLPALGNRTLESILTEFTQLLPTFKDDTTTGRNRSLQASLDYSLRRLSEEQRVLLARLVVFEGGASEDNLLAITEITDAQWAALRPALEQAALLTVEQIHPDIPTPFLHFHPVLVPSLRLQAGSIEDMALRQRYTHWYYDESRSLYEQVYQYPPLVHAQVQKELPNLRRTLELLLQEGQLDPASAMADQLAQFLSVLGLVRERDQMRQRVEQAITVSRSLATNVMSYAEYMHEIGMAEDERSKGKLRNSLTRLTTLLTRIQAEPEGSQLGPGTFAHSRTLQNLAYCLRDGGQISLAEARLRESLSVVDELLKKDLGERGLIILHATTLRDLATVLRVEGQYSQAQEMFEQALQSHKAVNDTQNEATTLGELGNLALQQKDFAIARARHEQALQQFNAMNEPGGQAVAWHNLGLVAQEQAEWAEAERCYRESLALYESLGNTAGEASICNLLAVVTAGTGRYTEAEGWYKSALQRIEGVEPGGRDHAFYLSNFAGLLVNEVRLKQVSHDRLVEAQRYAEQALYMIEKPGVTVEVWNTYNILAQIAELQGRTEAAQEYRRRERESFATFPGNRSQVDSIHAQLLADIVAATQGNSDLRAKVEAAFPELERLGWRITSAVQQIWQGERNLNTLTAEIDPYSALLIQRVLETL